MTSGVYNFLLDDGDDDDYVRGYNTRLHSALKRNRRGGGLYRRRETEIYFKRLNNPALGLLLK